MGKYSRGMRRFSKEALKDSGGFVEALTGAEGAVP